MATERIAVRKIREILRLKWAHGMTHRACAQSLGVSAGTVGKTVSRALAAGLDWQEVCELEDAALEERLYGPPRAPTHGRVKPDPAVIHLERKKPGVTLELLHLEYLEQNPGGYSYTVFCDVYREWLRKRKLSMRQVHRGGEKLFVDYSGKRPVIRNTETGEDEPVELFVAVLGASNMTYAEATRTQRSQDFIASHVRTFEYLGGVPGAVVIDQLRSGVARPCRYEPFTQRTYAEMARHYDTVILPARPYKPQDKASVEVAVQIVQRWILARLRNRVFFSLEALNEAIWALLEDMNNRTMRRYGKSRRKLFEEIDAPALRPLRPDRFVFAEWKAAKVNIDYHIVFDGHFYSVPFSHAREAVELRATMTTLEVFCKGKRIASHPRSHTQGGFTTEPAHMPKSHRAHLEWTPTRMISWAKTMGPHVEAMVTTILNSRPHPEMGYRSCLGILRLEKRYGATRLDAACERALTVGARSYRHIDSILKNNLDRLPVDDSKDDEDPITHTNIRGADYYH